jgi:exodeoxyribonuclease III
MKIISWNVNGIRAVERKGELDVLIEAELPDVLMLQETKASADQLSKNLTEHPDYFQYYHRAEKKGYSGTSIWVKRSIGEQATYSTGMTGFDDTEGRISQLDLGNLSILGIYFPNGGKSEEAWNGKLVFYDKFLAYTNGLRDAGRTVIWAGDVNCAHEEIDLARPKTNKTSIGFLPEERAWVSKVIENGWVDVFRKLNPEKIVYSWWHLISKSRARNVGWRIDYFFIDQDALETVTDITYLTDQMGSDHCPVRLEINN